MNLNSILAGLGVAAVIIASYFIGVAGKSTVTAVDNVGGQRAGLQEFTDGAKLGSQTTRWYSGTIPASDNQEFWYNNTGKTVYVDLAEMITTGTASSTYDFFVGTTTSASLSSDFTDPFSTLIHDFNLATSTTIRAINSIKDAGTNGRSVIPVAAGEYVFFTFQQTFDNACTGSVCETATSTNRGFNVNWNLRIHY